MRKYIFVVCCFLLSISVTWGQAGWGTFPGIGTDVFSALDSAFNSPEWTPEDDYYLGRAVAANILAMPNYQLYTGNPRLTEYLNRICQTLVINSSHPVNFNGYHVAILNSMEFNAFATPGGHILITRGLIEAATSEDALAALIAHELSHIILRHAAEIIEGMALSNELDEIARRAAALSGNSRAAQQALALRRSVSPIVDAMIKNGYSQDQELKADIKALELLDAAGYDPRGLLDMLRILQQVQAGRSGGFNNTHPTPAQRITNVNLNISRYRSNTTQTFRQPRFFNK